MNKIKFRTKEEWENLNNFQNNVLFCILENKNFFNNFIFAGGTVLSKCYLDHRNSEDLDFQCLKLSKDYFFTESKYYSNILIKKLKEYLDSDLEPIFDDNYHCLFFKNNNNLLKIENVNYFDVMDGKPIELESGLKVDNLKNILSSKITTFCNRQQSKDLYDILVISLRYNFDWKDIFSISSKKQLKGEDEFNGSIDNFLNSMKSFDFNRLIDYINSDFCIYNEKIFKNNEEILELSKILTLDVLNQKYNSLSETNELLENAKPKDFLKDFILENDLKNLEKNDIIE